MGRAKSIDGAEHSVTIEGVMAGVGTRGLEPIQMMRQHVGHMSVKMQA